CLTGRRVDVGCHRGGAGGNVCQHELDDREVGAHVGDVELLAGAHATGAGAVIHDARVVEGEVRGAREQLQVTDGERDGDVATGELGGQGDGLLGRRVLVVPEHVHVREQTGGGGRVTQVAEDRHDQRAR